MRVIPGDRESGAARDGGAIQGGRPLMDLPIRKATVDQLVSIGTIVKGMRLSLTFGQRTRSPY
jgi:hypothetical protein